MHDTAEKTAMTTTTFKNMPVALCPVPMSMSVAVNLSIFQGVAYHLNKSFTSRIACFRPFFPFFKPRARCRQIQWQSTVQWAH